MFPQWEQLLDPTRRHDGNHVPACDFTECPPPPPIMFYTGCPACIIAAHALAMNEADSPIQPYGERRITRLAPEVNKIIAERQLPLPRIPLDHDRT